MKNLTLLLSDKSGQTSFTSVLEYVNDVEEDGVLYRVYEYSSKNYCAKYLIDFIGGKAKCGDEEFTIIEALYVPPTE